MRYVSDTQPGIRRRRCGQGFVYFDEKNRRIADASVLDRIRALAVPPAYQDVWICPAANGHLQATGRDERGRKQYRYHALWRRRRDASKFDHLVPFGRALPTLRRRMRLDIARGGWPREKVVALVVRLLDQTGMRVGNEEYVEQNGHYGLTTLRTRHVRDLSEGLELRYLAKGGQTCHVMLSDARIIAFLRRMQRLPGQRLFQYRDAQGKFRAVDSGMVNQYLHDAMKGDFTAKDFRTWIATVEALRQLADAPSSQGLSERHRKRIIKEAVARVAALLRNTPAVCRSSYIDPRVLAAWEDGRIYSFARARSQTGVRQREAATLRLLRSKS
ncbi:DNA topoisomerase IB [Dyella acidiphila]|uniref:DNA topoisomerase IB n=1 Tax=Dyella acidiphila TaxID=2775866 RepID=UPI001CE496B8|nr:DNA topoisomerase IB [Dyella acidiphila]